MSEVVDPSLEDRSTPRGKAFSCHGGHLHGAFSDVHIPLSAIRTNIHGVDVLAGSIIKKRREPGNLLGRDTAVVPPVDDRGKVMIRGSAGVEKGKTSLNERCGERNSRLLCKENHSSIDYTCGSLDPIEDSKDTFSDTVCRCTRQRGE